MLTALLKRQFEKMGRRYDYDVTYMHELADVDPAAIRKFAFAMPFVTHDGTAPKNAHWAAKLRAVMYADCGSCLRLNIDMAREAGLGTELIHGICLGEPDDRDAALGARYADAVLAGSPELVDVLADVESRYGKSGLADLAIAVISGQFFPTLKRALGHGNACEPVLKQLQTELAA